MRRLGSVALLLVAGAGLSLGPAEPGVALAVAPPAAVATAPVVPAPVARAWRRMCRAKDGLAEEARDERRGAVRNKGPRRGRAAIPADTVPPEHPELWPRSLAVEGLPILVHYRTADEEATARTVARLLVPAWRLSVDTLGFHAPPDDGGAIGPDGRFDVYLWKGLDECWVDVHGPIEGTAWDDVTCFMAIDPWGSYGGDALASTVAHEFNHACQAADDWYDAPALYEMTATWVEQHVGGLRLAEPLADFQAHPDWGLDHDDDYASWFMYGSALFLDFLQERRFAGDPHFMAAVWHGCRSPAGAEDDPSLNEPDALDAFDARLHAKNSSLDDALLEFARWRTRIGRPGPGGIVTRLAPVAPATPMPSPDTARVATTRARFRAGTQVRFGGPRTGHAPGRVEGGLGPMRLGSRYVTLTRGPNDPARLRATLELAAGVRWVVQSIPGAAGEAEGARVALSPQGTCVVSCAPGGEVVLVLTALPEGGYDTDARDDKRFRAMITLDLAP